MVVCKRLGVCEYFLGVPIMLCVLVVLTRQSTSFARLEQRLQLVGLPSLQIRGHDSSSEEPASRRSFIQWCHVNTTPSHEFSLVAVTVYQGIITWSHHRRDLDGWEPVMPDHLKIQHARHQRYYLYSEPLTFQKYEPFMNLHTILILIVIYWSLYFVLIIVINMKDQNLSILHLTLGLLFDPLWMSFYKIFVLGYNSQQKLFSWHELSLECI